MVAAASECDFLRRCCSVLTIALLMAYSIGSMMHSEEHSRSQFPGQPTHFGSSDGNEIWSDGSQPWPQFGRTGTRIAHVPDHDPVNGGAGFEPPSNASALMPVISPSLNWVYGSYSIGTDSLGTPIANLSRSVTLGEGAEERCGMNSLYTIIVQTVDVSGSSHSMLRIIEGEDSDLAWQVDLGNTETVKASPVIVDIDDDGMPEVLVAYDAAGSLHVDAWSPRLSCSVTGWSYNGHSDELLWTWEDENMAISSDEGPYSNSLFGGHKPTTQILLADLDLDGDAELVIAAIDETSEEPVVLALPLQMDGTPSTLWEASLDKGSHPSDPAFAQVDDSTGYVLLTTIEANNGAMWAWKLDSSTGDSSWEGGLSLGNVDGDTNSPHIRLPGPVIANLDSDSAPEMIVTIPTDADGSASVDGAEYRGLEIEDGSELWNFDASNGFADAPPTAIDTDDDGQHDRVCWVTWWQSSTTGSRHGVTGCHDVDGATTSEAWNRELEQSSGVPNDEIAVAAASWMDIDGEGEQELLVPFGRTLWAFEGGSGTSSGVNGDWSDGIELDHRTWSSPSLADVDGDANLDIIIGSMAVSTAMPDVRPLLDGRGIEFNPSSPDPGEEVTVTAFIENAGTAETGENTDVVLYADGVEISRRGVSSLDPVDPSGSGSFASFSTEWSGELGQHLFELVLDPYRNLTQARFDNDYQAKPLSIVPTYNATFEMSTDPLRVDPGSSEIAPILVRSSGRLSGTWTLEVDGSTLPPEWGWSDETPGGIGAVEIGVDELWSPIIRVIAPSGALGSESGHLGLTITLDDDENVSISALLPVEANRTRGLSIRGPDGTSTSSGFGLLGEDAKAWILVENAGNAAEDQIAISWDGTDWGSDLRIFDSNGAEITALSLGPGEKKEMTARIQVPSQASHGDMVNTPLTMCVGAGEEQACSEAQLEFVASGIVVEPEHHRTTPTEGLEWTLVADLPGDSGNLSWSVSGAGMGIAEWTWSGGGQVSISGDSITLTGTPGSRASGTISLSLPDDAPPSFHRFNDATSSGAAFPLSLSLEVMQIHRAGLLVSSPSSQPYVIDVDDPSLVILRLENLGNGEDSYVLTHSLTLDGNETIDAGIEILFSSNPITLDAGSLRTVPLSVTMSKETPARVPIAISFTMTSVGNDSVSDSEEVIFEVRQDHRWNVFASFEGKDANESTFFVTPGQSLGISVNATNNGNLDDDISLEVLMDVTTVSGDDSQGWNATGDSKSDVGVNQSANLEITATSPDSAWNGSRMTVTVSAIARDQTVMTLSFHLEVVHLPSWTVTANHADLEIEPDGSQVELTIVQSGNSPSRPYASVYITGESGWEVGEIGDLPIISPGATSPLFLNITPPKSAMHGMSLELHVRIREGDSSALVEVTLPLRVAITHDFSMEGEGPWLLSSLGGHPMATLTNLGNSPTTIALEVLSLPDGWSVSGGTTVVLGAGEQKGIPLDIVPSDDWDGSEKTIRVLAQDPVGNQQEILLSAQLSTNSWASSPFISAVIGDDAIVSIHGTGQSSSVVDSNSGTLQWREGSSWLLPVLSSQPGTISIDSQTSLNYYISASERGSRDVLCFISGDFPNLEASCSIGNGSEDFAFSALLISEKGLVIDSKIGTLAANHSSAPINLTADDWHPDPGMRKLSIRVLDGKGRLIESTHKTFEIRRSDWNVGLVALELEGQGSNQKIKVLTKRLNENLLADADCTITLDAGTHHSEYVIDMTQVFVPTPKLDRPDVADNTEAVVTIGCAFPWDADSDSNDDVARILLSGGADPDQNLGDLSTGAIAAILVIGVYFSLAWIVSNFRERERMMSMTQAALEEKATRMGHGGDQDTPVKDSKAQDEEGESPPDGPPAPLGEESNEQDEEVDEFESRLRRLLDK